MLQLDLDVVQTAVLKELLEKDLTELGSEIHKTDAHDYRERLRQKRTVMRSLLEMLEGSAAA